MTRRRTDEEQYRRGLELQAALPEPTRARQWDRLYRRSEKWEMAEGAVELAGSGGWWAALLAGPAAIVALFRRK